MNRYVGIVMALLTALVFSTSVNAQSSNWSGCHLGLNVGMGSVNNDVAGLNGWGSSGGIYGVGIGCDVMVPDTQFLVGVFADYEALNMDSSIGPFVNLSYDSQKTIGARVGALITPSTLAYVLVGYSELDTSALKVLGKSFAMPDYSGATVGGGLETDIGANLRLGLEYRYSSYDSEKVNFHHHKYAVGFEPEVQTVRLGLKWAFWAPEPTKTLTSLK